MVWNTNTNTNTDTNINTNTNTNTNNQPGLGPECFRFKPESEVFIRTATHGLAEQRRETQQPIT